MLMMNERRSAIRTLQGWAISVLLDAGAIRECEEHGWMKDRTDPDARLRALVVARQNPPSNVSPEEAVAAIEEVLGSIRDTCPECPPERRPRRAAAACAATGASSSSDSNRLSVSSISFSPRSISASRSGSACSCMRLSRLRFRSRGSSILDTTSSESGAPGVSPGQFRLCRDVPEGRCSEIFLP